MESNKLSEKARMIVAKDMSNHQVIGLLQNLLQYDKVTYEHSINVAYIAAQVMIDKKVEKKIAKQIVQGALLHDVGKLDIPPYILKKADPLSESEFALIKSHPQYGIKIAREKCPDILTPIVYDIILHHHELEGGGGYPDNIKNIDKYTLLISIIDKYEAMTAERGYGKRFSAEYSLSTLEDQKFDLDAIYAIKNCEVI